MEVWNVCAYLCTRFRKSNGQQNEVLFRCNDYKMHVSVSWTAACLLERRGVLRFSQTTASRKKVEKNGSPFWKFEKKPLPLHPLLKTRQQQGSLQINGCAGHGSGWKAAVVSGKWRVRFCSFCKIASWKKSKKKRFAALEIWKKPLPLQSHSDREWEAKRDKFFEDIWAAKVYPDQQWSDVKNTFEI